MFAGPNDASYDERDSHVLSRCITAVKSVEAPKAYTYFTESTLFN